MLSKIIYMCWGYSTDTSAHNQSGRRRWGNKPSKSKSIAKCRDILSLPCYRRQLVVCQSYKADTVTVTHEHIWWKGQGNEPSLNRLIAKCRDDSFLPCCPGHFVVSWCHQVLARTWSKRTKLLRKQNWLDKRKSLLTSKFGIVSLLFRSWGQLVVCSCHHVNFEQHWSRRQTNMPLKCLTFEKLVQACHGDNSLHVTWLTLTKITQGACSVWNG